MMEYRLYTGCYTGPTGGKGVGLWSFDAGSGALNLLEEYPCENPSFLAVTAQCVYAASERPESGTITALRREKDGTLRFLNCVDSDGGDMCHLYVWPDGKHISAANYRTGDLLVRCLEPDGSIGAENASVQHFGVGFLRDTRQEGPHVHATVLGPDGRLYASDLGLDWLSVYDTGTDGSLAEAPEPMQLRLPEGEGPRHFLFTENGKYLYLVTELSSKLWVFSSPGQGEPYAPLQSVSTLPPEFEGENLAADIHGSPDGRFLYVSNRGHDSVARFSIDPMTGNVTPLGHFPSGGSWPRNFCLTPDGKWMIVANQFSGDLCVFPVDPESGGIGAMARRAEAKQACFVTAVPYCG